MECTTRSWLRTVRLLRGERRSGGDRSEEHTSELQSQSNLVCRLLLEKKKHCPRRADRPSAGSCWRSSSEESVEQFLPGFSNIASTHSNSGKKDHHPRHKPVPTSSLN